MNKELYKWVLDIGDIGELRIDIRKLPAGKNTIGHLVLSKTGLKWMSPRSKKVLGKEILWNDFAIAMSKGIK